MAAAAASSSSSGELFEWGERVKASVSSYEWMRYRGVRYSLYDCVHVRSDRVHPHVGKIMRLWEEDGKRKLRVRWFLREYELPLPVRAGLSSDSKDPKELFIAVGSVKGVENEILVETILRKVTVLCTATFKVPKNLQPAPQHVDEAHYFFGRAYDAKEKKLVRMDKIFLKMDRTLALKLWNKAEWIVYEDIKSPTSVMTFETVARKRSSPIAEVKQSSFTDAKKLKSEA